MEFGWEAHIVQYISHCRFSALAIFQLKLAISEIMPGPLSHYDHSTLYNYTIKIH